jgi:hypothetical protein
MRNLPPSAWGEMTVGMLVNYCAEYDREQKRIRGERVNDPEEHYQHLKLIEPDIEILYRMGKVSETKYKSFRKTIEDYENLLKE